MIIIVIWRRAYIRFLANRIHSNRDIVISYTIGTYFLMIRSRY